MGLGEEDGIGDGIGCAPTVSRRSDSSGVVARGGCGGPDTPQDVTEIISINIKFEKNRFLKLNIFTDSLELKPKHYSATDHIHSKNRTRLPIGTHLKDKTPAHSRKNR